MTLEFPTFKMKSSKPRLTSHSSVKFHGSQLPSSPSIFSACHKSNRSELVCHKGRRITVWLALFSYLYHTYKKIPRVIFWKIEGHLMNTIVRVHWTPLLRNTITHHSFLSFSGENELRIAFSLLHIRKISLYLLSLSSSLSFLSLTFFFPTSIHRNPNSIRRTI